MCDKNKPVTVGDSWTSLKHRTRQRKSIMKNILSQCTRFILKIKISLARVRARRAIRGLYKLRQKFVNELHVNYEWWLEIKRHESDLSASLIKQPLTNRTVAQRAAILELQNVIQLSKQKKKKSDAWILKKIAFIDEQIASMKAVIAATI